MKFATNLLALFFSTIALVANSSTYSETQLLQQLSEGSELAMKNLFDSFYPRLHKYVSSFIKSDVVAEELVMDVFLKIWLGRDLAGQINNLDAFLFRVTKNKVIDFLRSTARNPTLKELLLDNMSLIANEQADSNLRHKEFEEKLREAIHLLPPKCKTVYLLSREEELSHLEIAEKLGISRHTINNHIVEAQRFIRRHLTKHMDIAFLILVASKNF